MISLRLETVLVGDVVQSIFLAISSDPSDSSTDNQSFLFCSNIFQLGLFWAWNAVAGFIAE